MSQSFYEILKDEGIAQLVEAFYSNVMEDERISGLFTTDLDLVKEKQRLFLTQFFGGPALYIQKFGHPRMRMRHMPHKIDEPAAIAWLQNMKKAIDTLDITDDQKVALFNAFPRLAGHMVNA